MNTAENQKKLTLFLYRNIARQTKLFDKEPKYKQYFVTPVELRQKLPKYYLPSFLFNLNFRVFFRQNLVNPNDHNEINNSLSIGFNVLKNLNLAKYACEESNKSVNNNSSNNNSTYTNPVNNNNSNNSNNGNNSSHNNSNNNSNNNNIQSINFNNGIVKINNEKLSNNSLNLVGNKKLIVTKDAAFIELVRGIEVEALEKSLESSSFGAYSKIYKIEGDNNNNNSVKKKVNDRCWPLESNEEIKPGTILISHPSQNNFFRKKIVLITHVEGGNYYGFIINRPISSGPAITYLQLENEEFNLENQNLSKNILKLAKYAQKRPLASVQNWIFGGPDSVKDHEILSTFQGLNGAQIIHPYTKITGSKKLRKGLYVGGNFKEIKEKIRKGEVDPKKIMMFVGCTVFNNGQLQKEINEGAWFKANCSNDMLFEGSKNQNLWAEALKSMGGDYGNLILN